MKTTVEIADPLFQEARSLAAKDGVTFRDLVEEGLRAVVNARKSAAEPFRLRDGSFHGQGLQSGIDWSNLAERAYENEGDTHRS